MREKLIFHLNLDVLKNMIKVVIWLQDSSELELCLLLKLNLHSCWFKLNFMKRGIHVVLFIDFP